MYNSKKYEKSCCINRVRKDREFNLEVSNVSNEKIRLCVRCHCQSDIKSNLESDFE